MLMMKNYYQGPVKAVILDWAGTGVDFGCFGPVFPIVQAFFEQGIELDMNEARGPMGLSKKEHIREILRMPGVCERWSAINRKAPGEEDVDNVFLLAEKYMLESMGSYSQPTPGAVRALKAFREMGLKIGSTTGYTSRVMDILIRQAAEYGYSVDCVCTAEEVYGQGRPSPFMIYKNAIRMGVFPMCSIVKIGDTPADMAEGLNAGCWTIGLTHSSSLIGLEKEELDALPADEREKKIELAGLKLKEAGAHFLAPTLADAVKVVEKIGVMLESGFCPEKGVERSERCLTI